MHLNLLVLEHIGHQTSRHLNNLALEHIGLQTSRYLNTKAIEYQATWTFRQLNYMYQRIMSAIGKPYIHIRCDSVLWTQCVEKASSSKWNPPSSESYLPPKHPWPFHARPLVPHKIALFPPPLFSSSRHLTALITSMPCTHLLTSTCTWLHLTAPDHQHACT